VVVVVVVACKMVSALVAHTLEET
jgi:hypothetical protein